jgi:hypothetical protein
MKNLSFQTKLVLVSTIIVFVVISIYLFDAYANNNLVIPQNSSREYFENFVINKIDNQEDLDLVTSLYTLDSNSQNFVLRQGITTTQENELRDIFENAGYFTRLENRNIETKTKLILNGYLGQLFRLDILGPILWLVIPSLIYFVMTIKKRETWEKFGILAYIIVFFVIAFYGYDNFRYQLTLVPLSLAIILYYSYEILSRNKQKKYIVHFLAFLLILSLANYTGALKRYLNKVLEEINDIYTTNATSLQNPTLYGNSTSSRYVRSHLPKSINETLDFIDTLNISSDNEMIVNNVFFPFYYTDKPFIYYWSHKDVLHTPFGFENLVSNRTDEEITSKITGELKAHYLLTLRSYLNYNKAFEDYLQRNSDIIFESGGYIIYKIRDN